MHEDVERREMDRRSARRSTNLATSRIRVGGVLRAAAVVLTGAVVLACSLAGSSASADATALPAECAASGLTVTCTYAYTGSEQTFAVPAGVTSVHVDAIGGAGGGQHVSSAHGGQGEDVTGDISVASQSLLYVEVGGAGGPGAGTPGDTLGSYDSYKGPGGFNGGGTGGGGPLTGGAGGGGASDVRTCSRGDSACVLTGESATDPRLLVASGGGGSSAYYHGGDAGGADGNPSQDPSCASSDPAADCTDKGRGGTGSAGGAGGAYAGSGTAGQGGDGAHVRGFSMVGGGGGGGGWFGGGGGGALSEAAYNDHANDGSASGGGGSNLVPTGGTATLTTTAPQVVISYTAVDSTGPAITITAPADGATYDEGQVVDADYSCSDDGLAASGVNDCAGPVPSGGAIDTTTLGDHAFTVSASDNAGNTSSKTVHYTVAAAEPSGAPATQPPANQPLAPASQPSAPASVALGVLSHRRVKAKGRWALITLKCVGVPGQSCAGNIRLRPTALRSRLQSAASSGSRRTFRIAAGSSRTLRVALASASRTQLKHRRKSVAMAVITLAGGGAPLVRHMLVTVFPG